MKKAVVSNKIYMSVTEDLMQKIDKELTYTIPSFNNDAPPTVIKNMAVVKEGIIAIPSGRLDLIPSDYELVDKRLEVPTTFPVFKATLRESQQEVYDQLDSSCMINAKPSWGKTFTGLAIAAKLGQKTLVVVHTLALAKQWAEEVQKVFGIKAGMVGDGEYNINSPIVISNIQTLKKHAVVLSKEFGTLIVDECHHTPANTFTKVVHTSYAKYKIGLSGTLIRKDGRHVVLRDYFGNTVFKPPPENSMEPRVLIYKAPITLPPSTVWAKKINALCESPVYRKLVADMALSLANKGHKVLVIGERVEFLRACAELIGNRALCVTGSYISGNTKNRDAALQRMNNECDILFGTRSIFAEGISINVLSCLILGTPINNEPQLEQLIGRIIRIKEGKKQPLVVDINLKGYTAVNQAKERLGYYMRQGYEIDYL